MPKPLDIPPSELPVLVFDGDCGICRATAGRWRSAIGRRIEFVPFQEVGARYPHLGDKLSGPAIYFIDTDDRVSRGAEAVFRAVAHGGGKQWPQRMYDALPPFAAAAEVIGHLIAAFRVPLTFVARIWYGRQLKPPAYHIASALFLRLLGVVFLIAFVSLWTQIDGLVGDQGILPAKDYLEAVKLHFAQQRPPASPVWNVPTLAWINPHDGFLNLLCAAGAVLSLMLVLGVLPIPTLMLLWISYLSLVHVGQVFLNFQWDILLLETGVVAIFLAPFTTRCRLLADRHPPRLAIWLVWWLLFRLMLESGAVKLTWNDWELGPTGSPIPNTWETLTALDFHYWTQPLPLWTSWYAAKLPQWFQKLSVLGVFVVELVLPWLIFGPRLLRRVAFGGITALMLLIGGTGNYNFFNLLTLVLALTLLDDTVWPRFLQARITGRDLPVLASPTRWRTLFLVPFFALAILLGARQLREAIAPRARPGPSLESVLNIDQFFLVNAYGLFRNMTATRPEIVIEGSADGTRWKPYEFRWKPGDPARPPRCNTPHQPRLDWQMWFEALQLERLHEVLGGIETRDLSYWFQSFLVRLLEGEPKAVVLLEDNPFPNARPRFIRIVLYEYRFTDRSERRRTGNWWHRDQVWVGPAWLPP